MIWGQKALGVGRSAHPSSHSSSHEHSLVHLPTLHDVDLVSRQLAPKPLLLLQTCTGPGVKPLALAREEQPESRRTLAPSAQGRGQRAAGPRLASRHPLPSSTTHRMDVNKCLELVPPAEVAGCRVSAVPQNGLNKEATNSAWCAELSTHSRTWAHLTCLTALMPPKDPRTRSLMPSPCPSSFKHPDPGISADPGISEY